MGRGTRSFIGPRVAACRRQGRPIPSRLQKTAHVRAGPGLTYSDCYAEIALTKGKSANAVR